MRQLLNIHKVALHLSTETSCHAQYYRIGHAVFSFVSRNFCQRIYIPKINHVDRKTHSIKAIKIIFNFSVQQQTEQYLNICNNVVY